MNKSGLGLFQYYDFDGDTYSISIHWYDDEEEWYTAKWRRMSDGKTGDIGMGVKQCHDAYSLAEEAIRKERQPEKIGHEANQNYGDPSNKSLPAARQKHP